MRMCRGLCQSQICATEF